MELECNVKEQLNIVQQDYLLAVSLHYFLQQPWCLYGPLPLGEVKQTPTQCQIHVDVVAVGLCSYFSQRGRLAGTRGSYHKDQPVVQTNNLRKLVHNLCR